MRLDVSIKAARLTCRGRGSLLSYTMNVRPFQQIGVECDFPLRSSPVSNSSRQMVTVSHSMYAKVPDRWLYSILMFGLANPDAWGPLNEYDERVHSHQLREDEHQRGTHSLFEHLLSSTVPIDLLD